MIRRFLILIFLLSACTAQAQESDSTKKSWEVKANAFFNFIPDDFYIMPVVSADKGHLHLETRYNYEDRNTFSLWGGYNFSLGKKLILDATPILGFVNGQTDGIAPGLKFTLSYWKLSLYHESEYVISFNDSNENFYYLWSEFGLTPSDWITFGVVAQKTKAFGLDREVQRGAYATTEWKKFSFSGYYFNPFDDDQFFVLGISYTF